MSSWNVDSKSIDFPAQATIYTEWKSAYEPASL